MLNSDINKAHLLTNLILISIFTYVFYFSYKNIINLWTFSEIHINYSAGFVRRGFLGEILRVVNNYIYFDKIFFSTLFYIFSILNVYIILKIIKNITSSALIYFYLSFNPALILFSFYDLGGYARFEIFGLFLILLHTYFAQITHEEKVTFKKYLNFLIFFLYPAFYISILIHEVNLFFLLIHLYFLLSVFKSFNKIKRGDIIILFITFLTFVPAVYFMLSNTLDETKINIILNSLKYKENVEIWILKSIATTLPERISSELSFMSNPWTNLVYYFSISIFFLIPILFLMQSLSKNKKKDFIVLTITILPFFLLFLIGRDWGRWIHIIIMCSFCFFAQNKNNYKIKTINKKKLIIVFFLFAQITLTRIPHCCNLINKDINLYGGLIPKIKVFYEINFRKFNIQERFKNF